MKKQSLGVLLSVALLASWAAFAERVETNTNITFTADSDTSYEIDDGVTLTIEVASGDTYELSGQITGTGTAKLRKTGLGTLALSNGNNDIPGGIDIAQGTIRSDVEGCLGNAPITLSQTTANRGQIAFNAKDATFFNTISITGSAGSTFNASSPYALKFMQSATLKGNVTSSGTYTSFWNEEVSGLTAVFDGDVTCSAGSNRLYLRPSGDFVFNGAVTANRFRIGNSATSSSKPVYLNNPRNAITYLDTYSARVHCGDTNVLAGAYWTMPGGNSRGKDRDSLYLHGHDQTMSYLDSVATATVASDTRCPISSDEPCTLTLNGSGTRNSAHVFLGAVSLVINGSSKSFVQEFSEVKSTVDTIHSTTGTITVKKGTLKVSGVKTAFSGVPEITVEKDGTLDISTSGQTVFTSVTNIMVEGSLAIGQNAATPIAIGIANLTLGSNATFTVSNDQKVNFNEVHVVKDGVTHRLPAGNYIAGDEDVPQLLAGGFTVLNGATVVTEATWTGGGGSDTSIANEDNWSETGIDLDAGVLNPTFASGGATATVNKVVMFDNMVLSAAEGEAGFTFAKGAEDAAVVFAGTSLDITDVDSTARSYRFDVPVGVSGVQKLSASVPSSKTLVLGDGVDIDSGSLQFTGGGTVQMYGESAIEGALSLASGMSLFVSGAISAPGGVNQGLAAKDGVKTVTIGGSSTAAANLKGLLLSNATIGKPVCIGGGSSASTKYLLHTYANTTNVISGNLRIAPSDGRIAAYLRSNSELTCSGGVRITTGGPMALSGASNSRMIFTQNPVTSTVEYVNGATTRYFGLSIWKGRMVFDVCDNAIDMLRPGADNSADSFSAVDFMRSGMFSNYATTLAVGFDSSVGILTPHTTTTSQTVEFHSTTQRFARVISGKTATFTGTAGSLLEVYGAQMPDSSGNIHVTDDNLYVAAKFEGGLSLKMGGTGTLLLTNVVSSTSGGIEVTNGTVKIASDAAWTNAAYVVVGGAGRLEIDAAEGSGRLDKFGPETVVSLSEDGVMSVPNGTEVRVASIFVEGVVVPPGRYSYTSAPEPLKSHLADTTGVIVAGRPGLMILMR